MSTLTLYTNAMSRGNTIDLLFRFLDIPHQRIELAYGDEMHTHEYLALNPMGKVPTLTDGDIVVTESAAICLYLADKFPEKGLSPALNAPERANYYRWFTFAAGPLEAAFTVQQMGIELTEEQQHMSGFGSYQRVMACIESEFSKLSPYICGSSLTAVDIYLGYFLIFLEKINMLQGYPVITRYLNTLKQLPEFKAGMEN